MAQTVEQFSKRLLEHYKAEAEQRRQDRIAFGKALEERQRQDTVERQQRNNYVAPFTTTPKATKGERALERELFAKVEQTKEWKAYHAAAETRRNRKK